MFSCAVRTPPEHMWRSNTKQPHNVEIMLIVRLFIIRHNSYFFSRYYCAKSNIKCPKIVKNTLIFDTFSPVYMGFLAYRAQYYLILSIALLYIPSHCTLDISAPIFNGGWRRRSMPQPTTNLTNQCRDSISVNGVVILFMGVVYPCITDSL